MTLPSRPSGQDFALLAEFVDLPVPERERRLAQLFESDPETAQVLRELLAELPDEAPSGAVPPAAVGPAPQIAGYTVERCIGHGSMAAVWSALDHELERRVALKVLHPDARLAEYAGGPAGAERQRRRFEREARLVADLAHPGAAAIHRTGKCADGRPFQAMQLIEPWDGAPAMDTLRAPILDLGHWIQSPHRAANLRQGVRFIARAAEVLAVAHARGIVHRDLKPSHVRLGAFGRLVVVDWGLARIAGQADEESDFAVDGASWASQTMDGEVLGNALYMAPEQARGELERIGPAADVWALGAMLYQVLSGTAPFGDRARKTESTAERVLRVASERPTPIARLARRAPAPLRAIAERALEADPTERYADAAELRDDLERFLSGARVQAHTYRLHERIGRGLAKRPTATALSGMALITAAVLGPWISRNQVRAAEREDAIEHAQQRTNLLGSLTSNGVIYLKDAAGVSLFDMLKYLDERAEFHWTDPETWLGLTERIYLSSDNTYPAPPLMTQAVDEVRRLRPRDIDEQKLQIALARLLFFRCSGTMVNNEVRVLLEHFAGALEFLGESPAATYHFLSIGHAHCIDTGLFEAADVLTAEGRALLERLPPDPRLDFELRTSVLKQHWKQGPTRSDLDSAIQLRQELEAALDPAHPDLQMFRIQEARILEGLGEDRSARDRLESLVNDSPRNGWVQPGYLALVYEQLAATCLALSDHESAARYAAVSNGLNINKRSPGAARGSIAWRCEVSALVELGEFEQAVELGQRYLAYMTDEGGKPSRLGIGLWSGVLAAKIRLGRTDEALEEQERLFAIALEHEPRADSVITNVWEDLARAWKKAGRMDVVDNVLDRFRPLEIETDDVQMLDRLVTGLMHAGNQYGRPDDPLENVTKRLEYMERALEIGGPVLIQGDPRWTPIVTMRLTAALRLGDYEALVAHRPIVRRASAANGIEPPDPDVLTTDFRASWALRQLGRLDEQRAVLEDVREMISACWSEDLTRGVDWAASMAEWSVREGCSEEAVYCAALARELAAGSEMEQEAEDRMAAIGL